MFGIGGKYARLYGAWEERGVIGSRIEIDKNKVTVLWRGAPVLESGYTVREESDGALSLELKKTGMRYENSSSDYATVTRICEKDGRLTFEEFFPITGKSETVLTKTDNNRYGNYDVVTAQYLPQILGEWKDTRGYFELSIEKSGIRVNHGEKRRFVLLRTRWDPAQILLHDEDPSADMIRGLTDVTLQGDTITAILPVCDAPSTIIVFEKVRKK